MDLGKIIVPSKTIGLEYPGKDGFVVQVAYLTRDELMKVREKCVTQKFSRKTREMEEEVNNDLFQQLYIEAVIKGWVGLKYDYLLDMIPVDVSTIPEDEYQGGEGTIEYSKANAEVIMKNCSDFDNWVTAQLDDVANFTKAS